VRSYVVVLPSHPSHSRFCGKSWDDAANNCSIKRHCPSGDASDCPNGNECYSFLSGCNYLEMIGDGEPGVSAAKDGNSESRLSPNSPTRSNFCGSDWNDANSNCSLEDHWCQAGSDSDCPSGKVCFAGTECMYLADLEPTLSPIYEPTESPVPPTPSPVIYNSIENTSFCGDGWSGKKERGEN